MVVTVVFRTIGIHSMLLLLRFLRFFTFFFKIQKVVTFYVFCRVSYVFSNYDVSHIYSTVWRVWWPSVCRRDRGQKRWHPIRARSVVSASTSVRGVSESGCQATAGPTRVRNASSATSTSIHINRFVVQCLQVLLSKDGTTKVRQCVLALAFSARTTSQRMT